MSKAADLSEESRITQGELAVGYVDVLHSVGQQVPEFLQEVAFVVVKAKNKAQGI